MKIVLIPNAPRMTARHYCLAKALVANGHEVHYVMWELPYTLPPAEMVQHIFTAPTAKTYPFEEFTMHKFRRLPFFWPYINGWLFKRQIRDLYHKLDADIIFAESYTNETEVPKDLPFIYDLADDYAGPADVFGSAIYKLAFRLLDVRGVMKRQSEHALAVTVVSKLLAEYAAQYNDTVVRLPNGVNAEVVRAALRTAKPVTNNHSLVYATGFGQWSRVVQTMQMVTKLRAEFPDVSLTLIGDGTEVGAITSYIEDNQATDYIHYLGFVADQKKLFALINQSAIGLNVSDKNKWRDASQPMKVMDYTALGKKILSTDLEEIKNLNFKNIFIFSNEGDSFLKAARKALVSKASYTDYAELSEHILTDYDWSVIAEQLVELSTAMLVRQDTA